MHTSYGIIYNIYIAIEEKIAPGQTYLYYTIYVL